MNSPDPRSELRELTSSGAPAAWQMTTGGTLAATLKLIEVPDKVVIGQVHADKKEPLKIHVLEDGTIYLNDEATALTYHFPVKIPFGQTFGYLISASAKELSVDLTVSGQVYRIAYPTHARWLDPARTHYFKAGVYGRTNLEVPATAKYRAVFYRLKVTH